MLEVASLREFPNYRPSVSPSLDLLYSYIPWSFVSLRPREQSHIMLFAGSPRPESLHTQELELGE